MTSHDGTEPQRPTFAGWMGSMWLYTLLRFGLFFALWGILLLTGLPAIFAALIALVLSVPLSFVLLARPRQRFAAQLEARVQAQRARRDRLDAQLDPESHDPESHDPESHDPESHDPESYDPEGHDRT